MQILNEIETVSLEFYTLQEYLPKKSKYRCFLTSQKLKKFITRRSMGIRNESCVAGGNLHLYKEMKSIEKSEYLDKSKKPFHIVILISLKDN